MRTNIQRNNKKLSEEECRNQSCNSMAIDWLQSPLIEQNDCMAILLLIAEISMQELFSFVWFYSLQHY